MIGLAEKGMERQLDKLWRSSFNDPMRVTRYFLKYRFRPENCLVFQKDGEVVSGLYLLEAKIRLEGKLFPVQYIYAASTLPNYRNQGCMSQLLEFAEELGRQRGMACSVLVPATQSLFLYYGKFGYETFFYTRNVKIEKSRLKAIAFGGKGGTANISSKLLASVRTMELVEQEGNIIWGRDAVSFAKRFYRISGGNVLSAALRGNIGYAFFRKGESMGEVTELLADELTLPSLAYQILTLERCGMYHFRLPVNSPLFPEEGEMVPFGMLQYLQKDCPRYDGQRKAPYIGLELS